MHPETRVFAAVNWGSDYDVNDMDPALLRRFWVVDLDPTTDDWISWAKDSNIDYATIDFIKNHPEHLRPEVSSVDPGVVLPTPASWHRLDESLRHMNLSPSSICGTKPEGLYGICQGFVGTEASIAYVEFLARYESVITADDILSGKIEQSKIDSLSSAETLAVIDKVVEHSKTNIWDSSQAKNISSFVRSKGGEQTVYLWTALTKTQVLENIQVVHDQIGDEVVESLLLLLLRHH